MIIQPSITERNKKYICQPVNNDYICIIVRTQVPVIEVAYNILTKKGILTGAASNDDETQSVLNETMEWAQQCITFDEHELQTLRNDSCIVHAYKSFLQIVQKQHKPNWTFERFLNERPIL